MQTVADIYSDVAAMHAGGASPGRIRARIAEIVETFGFLHMNERDGPDMVEFTFPTGEMICFAGGSWRYVTP